MLKQSLLMTSLLVNGLTYAAVADQWQPVAVSETTTYLVNPTRIRMVDNDKKIIELWEKVDTNKQPTNPKPEDQTNSDSIRIVEKVATDRGPSNPEIKIGEFVLIKKQISCPDFKIKVLKTVHSNHDGKMDKGLLTSQNAQFVDIAPKSADEFLAKRACGSPQ